MKKLLLVFLVLLLLGVVVEAVAQETHVIQKPLCDSVEKLQGLVDIVNEGDVINEKGAVEYIKKTCTFDIAEIYLGKQVGVVTLRDKVLAIHEVLVVSIVIGEGLMMVLPKPMIMFGTFPIKGAVGI